MIPTSLKYTLVAGTADPGVNDDSKKGYEAPAFRENTNTGVPFLLRDNTAGAAKWNALGFWQHIGYVAGRFYPPLGSIESSGSTLTTGTIRAHLAFIPERITISELAAKVVTNIASTNFQCAIYSVHPTTKVPYVRLGVTGDISAAATGQINGAMTANVQIEPGHYWLALIPSSASISFTQMASTAQLFACMYGGAISDTLMGNSGVMSGLSASGQTYGTWPSDASGLTWAVTATTPAVIFKVASVP